MGNNLQVIDNFLPVDVHKHIKEYLIGNSPNFPWYFNNNKSADNVLMSDDSLNNFQFVHTFYDTCRVTSHEYDNIVLPILKVLNPLALIRVKANLTPITASLEKYGWHVDINCNSKHLSAVYYVNSNNGKTIFKDDLEIESVENRIVIFNSSLMHSGTSCTDSKVRCIININYIPSS